MRDTGVDFSGEGAVGGAGYGGRARIESVRGAGGWMPWVGLALAVIWWGCVAGALITVFDLNLIARQPPITLAAGALLALLPGVLLLMASFMARESARAAASNALVLAAADQLLSPASASAEEAETLAQRLTATAEEVDRAMGHALSAMKALSGEIGDERLRLESVTYAAADNARDLTERLQGERAGLEALIRDLTAQSQALNESIPRQVGAMVEATRTAGEDVARAEDTLNRRLESMQAASAALAGELAKLENLAGAANTQSEQLLFSIARIEEKIDQSRRTVEAAVQAGDTAAAAAGSTGDALRAAVQSALDDAARATTEIHRRTREASEDAARRIAQLRQSAEQASAALKATGQAAAQRSFSTDYGLPRPNGYGASAEHHAAARPSEPAPRDDQLFASAPEPPAMTSMVQHPAAPSPETPSPAAEDELFDGHPPAVATNADPAPETTGAVSQNGPGASASGTATRGGEDLFEPDDIAGGEVILGTSQPDDEPPGRPQANSLEARAQAPALPPSAQQTPPWTSILSDMDRDEAGELPREATAEQVIQRLEGSGIALASIFRPRDKKKIANAARKGDQPRRHAILSAARNDVERVSKRLRADQNLERLARDFVSMEEPDAIAALDRTQKSNRNASPRLSAFLLLDAAMEDRPGA